MKNKKQKLWNCEEMRLCANPDCDNRFRTKKKHKKRKYCESCKGCRMRVWIKKNPQRMRELVRLNGIKQRKKENERENK